MRIQTVLVCMFIGIFCCFFYLGAILLPSDAVLETERRKISEFPEFNSAKSHDLKKFFYGVDGFIADRLLFKEIVFKAASAVFSVWFYQFETDKAIRGTDDWIFLGNNYANVMNRHVKDMPLDLVRSNNLLAEFTQLKDAVGILNGSFFVLVCPDKHGIYYDNLPKFLRISPHNRYAKKIVTYLQDNGITVLDLFDGVKEQKKNAMLYYKTDTHWNLKGAEAGFNTFYAWLSHELLNRPLPSVPVYSLEQIPPVEGDLISIGGFYGFRPRDDANYRMNLVPDRFVTWTEQGVDVQGFVTRPIQGWKSGYVASMRNAHAPNKFRILIFCDSFMKALAPFFNLVFSEVYYVSASHTMHDKLQFIRELAPNFVVYETVERGL